MDDKIRVGHPFYFPTQAVLVDDDPDFLEGISLIAQAITHLLSISTLSTFWKPRGNLLPRRPRSPR